MNDFENECKQQVISIAEELDELATNPRQDNDDREPYDLTSYFEDCLDIEYRIDGRGNYRSVKICLACGGPNIYVDTNDNAVKLYWGGTRAAWCVSHETSDAIDDIFEEDYNCIK